MNRILTAASLGLLAAGGLLAGCHRAPDAAADQAMPDVRPGIVVTAARLVLPAVPGRPGAFYFTVANAGTTPANLTGIEITGAGKSEMHETVGGEMKPMPFVQMGPGQVINFDPGARHVMVFDIKPTVKAGGTVDVTLHFKSGRVFNTLAKVEPAGGGADDGMAEGGMAEGGMNEGSMNMAHGDHAH